MGWMGIMGGSRRDAEECSCPYTETGQGVCTDPTNNSSECWSPPGQGVGCFDATQSAFLSGVVGEKALNKASCRSLLDLDDNGEVFWALYELDTKYCGLQRLSLGKNLDAGVGNIINTCDNIGVPNLKDPGWPSTDYVCRLCPATIKEAEQIPTLFRPTPASATSTILLDLLRPITASSSPSSVTTASLTIAPSLTSSTTLAPDITTPPGSSDFSRPPFNHISTQGIVAIAVCSSLAVVSAIALLMCALRRRRKQREEADNKDISGEMLKSGSSRGGSGFMLPPAKSYQPLISPSHSVRGYRQGRLTPPLRLRERKLLPALLRPISWSDPVILGSSLTEYPKQEHTVSNSRSVYSITAWEETQRASSSHGSFPSSSVCTPTKSKLEPHQEKMQAAGNCIRSRLRSPPPVTFTFPTRLYTGLSEPVFKKSATREPLIGVYFPPTHGMGGSAQTADSAHSFAPTPPSSPNRPRRPHEDPLEIPGLVSPMQATVSPSPNRAPPPRPLPSSSAIGVARTTSVAVSAGSLLQRLVEAHHRGHSGSRDSWGSWGERDDHDDDDDEDDDDDGDDEDDGDDGQESGGRTAATSPGRLFGISFLRGAAISGKNPR